MIPEVPSGLNLAEGLVITSIRSILSAGNCSRICARLSAESPEARPLIHTVTSLLPRKDTSPSLSTSTGNIGQNITGRSSRRRDILIDIEYFFIDIEFHLGTLAGDLDFAEQLAVLLQ